MRSFHVRVGACCSQLGRRTPREAAERRSVLCSTEAIALIAVPRRLAAYLADFSPTSAHT